MMTFKEYSHNSRTLIADHLAAFMLKKKEEALPGIFKEQGLINSLESFVLGGKLIRGTLFLLIAEALGVKRDKDIVGIACAIEFMHSALLIQDDIIDNDKIRRGNKTIFAQYSDDGERAGAFEPYHYGVSTALMVADIAFFFAVELLSDYDKPQLGSLLKYYAHEIYLVALAESADSIFGQTKREPTKDEIYALYTYKTARYTFSLPFEMAVIIAGGNEEVKGRLSRIGEKVGIIFQLRDDEIGLFGDADIIGKPTGGDIRENKKTIIRQLLYKNADDQDKKILDACFGEPTSGIKEVEKVKHLYEKYEIKKYIDDEVRNIMKTVWQEYDTLEMESDFKEILKDLFEYNLSRSY